MKGIALVTLIISGGMGEIYFVKDLGIGVK